LPSFDEFVVGPDGIGRRNLLLALRVETDPLEQPRPSLSLASDHAVRPGLAGAQGRGNLSG